jgi:hypothetical protein
MATSFSYCQKSVTLGVRPRGGIRQTAFETLKV